LGYEQARAHLDALGVDQMKTRRPSTARIEALCEALDHPERAVPAIHVTGTNGKTSVARIASSVLAAAGLKVGTYTSPHLEDVTERIALNGQPISEEAFGGAFDHLAPYLELVTSMLDDRISYFEVLTAMFFVWAAENVEAMVVEVGLGGRWDATNVVNSPVAVITNISLDHTGMLGSDPETIAREKAGIIKPGAEIVTAELVPSVLEVIAEEADHAGASLARIDRDFAVTENRVAVGGRYLSLRTSTAGYEGLFLPLHGRHQGVNAMVAVEAAQRFLPARSLSHELVSEGFAGTQAPGRLETIRLDQDSAPVVLDVAHNPDGMSALVSSLVEAFAFERAVFVVGILADKDYRGMLAELTRVPCSLIATFAKNVRSAPVEELALAADELALPWRAIDDVAKATDQALAAAAPAELVCVCGSHYVVGEARAHLMRR
jgi:dihydrofolate synthase / folylpolyglutamate synthase